MSDAPVTSFPRSIRPGDRASRRVRRLKAVPSLPVRAVELTLEPWFECYLADCEARGLTERTLEWYRDRGARILSLLRAAGVSFPNELSRRVVSELFGALRGVRCRGRPLAPQTIHGYWQVGKGFTTFLIAEEAHPGPNPFDEFGRPRVPEKSMWAPSAEECTAMLEIPDRRSVLGL